MALDLDVLQQWVGRQEQQTETAESWPILGALAALDVAPEHWPAAGDPIPETGHWCYFPPRARQSGLGEDGHPRRGGFLPPIPLPRRMWAGSRIRYEAPIRLGDTLTRVGEILDVNIKQGKTGTLAFVTVQHSLSTGAGLALVEEQDLVFREAPPPGAAIPAAPQAPTDAQWSDPVTPDSPLLFRYSAVTFNGHRIHYDAPYATGVEGYPGLIVHGPLLATFLIRAWRARHPHARLRAFRFRAVSPVFCDRPLCIEGRVEQPGQAALWVANPDGGLHMQAEAAWDPV